jgi:hypothetical protein
MDLSLLPNCCIRGQQSHAEATTGKSTGSHSQAAINLNGTASTTSTDSRSSWMDFDIKMQQAMEELTLLKNKIESNQTALMAQRQASDARMKKLEESVLRSFDNINILAKNHESLQ